MTRKVVCTAGAMETTLCPPARQVWLKVEGKCRVMELGEEKEKELEEKVRGWMGVERERWESMW